VNPDGPGKPINEREQHQEQTDAPTHEKKWVFGERK